MKRHINTTELICDRCGDKGINVNGMVILATAASSGWALGSGEVQIWRSAKPYEKHTLDLCGRCADALEQFLKQEERRLP